jgi:hypothetical protein
VALLPPIPDRPADRPETWTEYLSRRAIVAMHRQLANELASWLKAREDGVRRLLADMADNRVPLTKTWGQPMALAYGAKRVPSNVVFTWRNDAARRLLADPSATGVLFTDKGLLQVTDLNIDLAPELKELIGTTQRDGQ